jgi:hypothetical protein
MAMNCMKKLEESGRAAPRIWGRFEGFCTMALICWKKVLPIRPWSRARWKVQSNITVMRQLFQAAPEGLHYR